MFLTNTAFTLSWKPKASGANSYAKVYQLTTASNAENEISLIETNGEHWLTNRYQTGTLSTSYDTSQNCFISLSNFQSVILLSATPPIFTNPF